MNKKYRPLWLSLSLTTLFFYPLTMSLFGNGQYYMHWKLINALEFLLAFIIFFSIFAFCLFYIDSFKSRLLQTISILIVAFLPLIFFTLHLTRQFIGKSKLIFIAEYVFSIYGFIFLGILFVILLFTTKIWFVKLYESIISILFILLPVSFLTILSLCIYGFDGHKDYIGQVNNLVEKKNTFINKNNIFVFLFDELDYSILYGIDGKIRKKYSNFREFSSKSSNYHNAYAPGSGTIVSLPQMLMGKKLANVEVCGNYICIDKGGKKTTLDFKNNLFSLAKKNNFKTALIGWVHKYCEQYESSLDFCRSYGLYNFSSFYSKFSILNPIYTNIVMLPHQMPFGLLKNPVYSNLHHKNNINVKSLILDIIEKSKDGSVFTFVHHNLPHSPFIYKDDTYKPGLNPFQQSMEKYEAQLLYLDKQFGDLINKIKSTGKMENSTIVVLSDHGFRILDSQGNSQGKKDHVPMIVYKGNMAEYIEIKDKVKTEKILFSLLE